MSRYTSKVSNESEIEAGENNPVLDSEIENQNKPEETVDNDFELVLPEDIDSGEAVKEIQESVASSEQIHLGLVALEHLHQEMSVIVATDARMRTETARIFTASVEHLDLLMGYDGDSKIPSLEAFDTTGLACSSTQISVEGVLDRIDTAIGKFMYSIGRLANNLVGLARSATPILDKIILEAKALKGELNNAHRDAGQKEISAKGLNILTVDGKTPDAATVIKTVKYLNDCSSEILSTKVIDIAEKYTSDSLGLFAKALDDTIAKNKGYSSGWWAIFGKALGLAAGPFGKVASTALVGNSAETAKRVIDNVGVDGSLFPGLFALFPTVSKVNHSFINIKRNIALESKRSLPLFNDKVIVVSQFRKTIPVAAATNYTPAISLITLEGQTKPAKSIQTLKPAEQKIVLDELIALAESSKAYFKAYGARSKGCYDRFVKMYEGLLALRSKHGTVHKTYVMRLATNYTRFLSRAFWNGIFAEQSRIALYNRDVASGLLRYVKGSNRAANGKPATESNDLNFDFD